MMTFVSNARDWLKMYSVQVFLFITAMGAVQLVLPFVGWLLPWWLFGLLTMLAGIAGVLARLMKQWNLTEPKELGMSTIRAIWSAAMRRNVVVVGPDAPADVKVGAVLAATNKAAEEATATLNALKAGIPNEHHQ